MESNHKSAVQCIAMPAGELQNRMRAHTCACALTAFGNTNNVARDVIMPRTSDAAQHLQLSAIQAAADVSCHADPQRRLPVRVWQLKGSQHAMRTAQRSAQNNGWPHIQHTPDAVQTCSGATTSGQRHGTLPQCRLTYSLGCGRHHSGPLRGGASLRGRLREHRHQTRYQNTGLKI